MKFHIHDDDWQNWLDLDLPDAAWSDEESELGLNWNTVTVHDPRYQTWFSLNQPDWAAMIEVFV
jgi:hypothetical protein